MKKLFMIVSVWFAIAYANEASITQTPTKQTTTITKVYATFDVEANQSATLAFSSSGMIDQINVEVGSMVKKGDTLATLQNDDVVAMVEVSQIATTHALREYERYKKVKEHINALQLDNFAYKYENAKAQLRYQKTLLEKTFLRAPFDGVITQKNVEIGDVVSGQMITHVFSIQSTKARKLLLKFDQKYVHKVKVGNRFIYKIDGDMREHEGVISKIYPAIDTASRKAIAEVKAKGLPVGLFGSGSIMVK
jgi:membrane fusion protein (multidrug efflux system)